MDALLLELAKPRAQPLPTPWIAQRLADTDRVAFCFTAYRSGLVALVYESLRRHAQAVPNDILEWLRVQYFQLLARHRSLLQEVDHITAALASQDLPVLLFKGPALDEVSAGGSIRLFADLDILVRREDLPRVSGALGQMGYVPAGGDHPFHLQLVRRNGLFPVMVEVHFDLFDPERSYFPDLNGIWRRSVRSETFRSCLVPELTDHLLLVAMQLPHHHWSPRLIVDIGRLVYHRAEQIDWAAVAERARAWGMRSVSGAGLYVAASLLDVPLPADAEALALPRNFAQRVQWNIAAQASREQFTRPVSRLAPLAACLFVDRAEKIPPLVFRRVMRRPGNGGGRGVGRGIVRRLAHGVMALPAVGRVLLRSLLPRRSPVRPASPSVSSV